jgi:7-keto-8-aminopelargonate synthetase-like enzyme
VIPLRAELAGRLDALEAEGLRRALITVAPPAAEVAVAGQTGPVINLASNDYLGLAGHPALAEASARASRELGTGAGASRLVTGNMAQHEALERELAALLGEERVLLYGSGYLAHVGTIPALMDSPDDVVYSDQLNHASIVDGCRLARARVRLFRHRDVDQLEQLLAEDNGVGRRLVVTETVFSMDGDEAPLERICELAARFDAWVLADEAHAFGVRGPRGGGVVAERGLEDGDPRQGGRIIRRLRRRGGGALGVPGEPLASLRLLHRAAAARGGRGRGRGGADRRPGGRAPARGALAVRGAPARRAGAAGV